MRPKGGEMSGHSKWAQIKRQKGVADTRRGQVFTRMSREIMLAARQGGAEPEANFRLRLAIQKARDQNMPLENIERAIQRASGATESAALEEVTYEGYGLGGAAILVQVMTDNRNRTLSEIRNLFTRSGGSLGEAGSVAWQFEQKGIITVKASGPQAEELALLAIDLGAEDVKVEEHGVEIQTRPHDLEKVRKALGGQGLAVASTELTMLSKASVPVEEKVVLPTLKLLEKLEELDEVQHVYTNADFPNEVLERLQT